MAVNGEDVVALRILRLLGTARIGYDAHHAFTHLAGRGKNWDHIIITLAHLTTIQARDYHDVLADHRFRDGQDLPVIVGKGLSDVTRDLDVLFLISPNRDVVRAIQQDVRGHQDREKVEPGVDAFLRGV